MVGDWDTGRQPAVALHEPMAQRGERIDAGGMVVWECLSWRSLPHRRRRFGAKAPSYINHLFVGAALAATIASSRMEV
jgi:hypothetical protein